MDFLDVLRSRRSVRSFTENALDQDEIKLLLESATLAPSANDVQPWEFWVIEGKERISGLSKRAKEWLTEKVAHNPTAGAVLMRQHLIEPHFEVFHGAPVLILVVSKSYEKQQVEDCGLAAYALTLAARDKGIGTCWIGSAVPWLNQHSIKSEFGIPDGSCVVAPIVLGYPEAWPDHGERSAATIYWIDSQSSPR